MPGAGLAHKTGSAFRFGSELVGADGDGTEFVELLDFGGERARL